MVSVRANRVVVMLAVVPLAAVALVLAGPLDPPAGPVGSSYKTLNEVEPRTAIVVTASSGDATSVYRIATPGSYYLTGNVQGVAGRHGIKIDSDNVTLDLNGFTLDGAGIGRDGINVPSARRNIVVKNGTVRGFGQSGVFVGPVTGGVVRDIISESNLLDGVWVGSNMLVQNVKAITNGGRGFVMSLRTRVSFESCEAVENGQGFGGSDSSEMTFTNCVARSNSWTGFEVGADCRFTNCEAISNALSGFQTGRRARLAGCVADMNERRGIFAGENSTLEGCRGSNNQQEGIAAGNFSHLTGCLAHQNTLSGIVANGNSMVLDCGATGNGGNGILVTNATTVDRCSVGSNGGVGIYAGDGCMIRSCSTSFNLLDGVRVNASCSVLECTMQGDGSAPGPQGGVRIEAGTGNRVEGNNMVGCDNSVLTATAAAQGNFIARNTSRAPASSHFSIVANNSFGPVVTVTGVGNFGGVANSSHPMANFSY